MEEFYVECFITGTHPPKLTKSNMMDSSKTTSIAPYRIILVDDHEAMRFAIRMKLHASQIGVEIVGEAESGNALFEILPQQECDLVILDLSMPDMNGVQAFQRLREQYKHIKCMIYTGADDQEIFEVFRFFYREGIDGFLLKRGQFHDVIRAIEAIRNNECWYSPDLFNLVFQEQGALDAQLDLKSESQLESLTQREREIYKLVEQGKTSLEIAEHFELSLHTVRKHRQNINHKLRHLHRGN